MLEDEVTIALIPTMKDMSIYDGTRFKVEHSRDRLHSYLKKVNFTRILEKCLLNAKEYYQVDHDEELYLALRRLYTVSMGESSIMINHEISRHRPIVSSFYKAAENLHIIPPNLIDGINTDLQTSGGYATILVDIDCCWLDEIREILDDMTIDVVHNRSARVIINDWRILSKTKLIQKLCRDKILRYIADNYLKCRSLINSVSVWKTVYQPRNGHDMNGDAMNFHFDCDHNRFLKVFIYLDDVTANHGPHVYVEKTSAEYRKSLPESLSIDGRFSSLEVINAGLVPKIVTGEKGTIIFADTQNLHRGTPVHSGATRYILQLQFVDSVFGARPAHKAEDIEDMNTVLLEVAS